MGDQFILQVDRLLTESTLEAAIESANLPRLAPSSFVEDDNSELSPSRMDAYHNPSAIEFALCRICHDEDDYRDMDAPCSCRGSLKYAHRKCVQRWCNEKGDTMCEICQQPFKADYTAPPLFHNGGASMTFRGIWELPTRDLQDAHQLIAMVATDDDEYSDSDMEYSGPSPSSLLCCRIIAVTFMVLLVLRHILLIVTSGVGDYSLTLFSLLILRTIGIIFPIYIMVKAFTSIHHWRRFLDHHQFSETDPTDEDESDSQQVSRRLNLSASIDRQ